MDARIIFVLRYGNDTTEAQRTAEVVLTRLVNAGINPLSHEYVKAGDKSETFNSKDRFLIISVGGDGTFATACRDYGASNTQIVGVQAGTLNFLNAFMPENVSKIVWDDEIKVSQRTLGSIVDGMHFTNDAVVTSIDPLSMSDYTVFDGQGRFVMEFRGDGLIIATPMGSTAYNLSAGGPILHPTMQAFILTPKSPALLSARTMVIPMDVGLHIHTNKENFLVADGIKCDIIRDVDIAKGKTVDVLLPTSYSFFEQVRNKLGWYK